MKMIISVMFSPIWESTLYAEHTVAIIMKEIWKTIVRVISQNKFSEYKHDLLEITLHPRLSSAE